VHSDEPLIWGPDTYKLILEELHDPGDVALEDIDIRERCTYLEAALTHLHMELAGISGHEPSRRALKRRCAQKAAQVIDLLGKMTRIMESVKEE
tara:strand:+ start:3539 stop:3820 length:282 start_codon:yes stop_codon:yes gene_type:complete